MRKNKCLNIKRRFGFDPKWGKCNDLSGYVLLGCDRVL
jgi:hypothetical protein